MIGEMKWTLCFDCAKATGYCSWSSRLEPVEGWTAEETIKNTSTSFVVIDCPEFVRDAYRNGTMRLPKEIE